MKKFGTKRRFPDGKGGKGGKHQSVRSSDRKNKNAKDEDFFEGDSEPMFETHEKDMGDIEYKLSATDKFSWQKVAFDPRLFGSKADLSGLLSIETISGDAADDLLRALGKSEPKQNSDSDSRISRDDGSRISKVAKNKSKGVIDTPSLEPGLTATALKKKLRKKMLRERSRERRRNREAAAAAAPIASGEDDAAAAESISATDPAASPDNGGAKSAMPAGRAADPARKQKRRKLSAGAAGAEDTTGDESPAAGAGVKARAKAAAKARAKAGAAANAGAAAQVAAAAAAAEYDDAWEYGEWGGIMLRRPAPPPLPPAPISHIRARAPFRPSGAPRSPFLQPSLALAAPRFVPVTPPLLVLLP
jgi:hypothetical protein